MTENQQVTEEIVFIKRSVAASLSGVSAKTISSWCEAGKIKYQKDQAGRYLIDKASLDLVEPTELEDTGTAESKFVGQAMLMLGQAYTHIEKKEAHAKSLCEYITKTLTSRDSATIVALERSAKENASQWSELTRLRAKLLKMETDAAADAFDADSHLRSEDRKDNLVTQVIGAIQTSMGHTEEAKKVVGAVIDATKQK